MDHRGNGLIRADVVELRGSDTGRGSMDQWQWTHLSWGVDGRMRNGLGTGRVEGVVAGSIGQ